MSSLCESLDDRLSSLVSLSYSRARSLSLLRMHLLDSLSSVSVSFRPSLSVDYDLPPLFNAELACDLSLSLSVEEEDRDERERQEREKERGEREGERDCSWIQLVKYGQLLLQVFNLCLSLSLFCSFVKFCPLI